LHEASIRGHENSVRKLLRLGANPTVKNDFGETALDLAELMGRNEVVRILKAYGGVRRS
jgi:ankyrin repeat protein